MLLRLQEPEVGSTLRVRVAEVCPRLRWKRLELSVGDYDAPVEIENTAASSSTAGRYEFRCRPEDQLRIKIEVEETDDEAGSSTGSRASKNSLFSCCFSPSSRARSGALANASRTAGAGTTSKNAGSSSGAGSCYLEGCAVAVVAEQLPVTHTISLQKMSDHAGRGGVSPAAALASSPLTKSPVNNASCTSLLRSTSKNQAYVKIELAWAKDLFSVPEYVIGACATTGDAVGTGKVASSLAKLLQDVASSGESSVRDNNIDAGGGSCRATN
ncbi:unnamed protein product [Amoebophrya sp. A120]|nr:unnamed protein product [Amoebophrya sp. A120]|eukprot:GSA120T00000493001.1